MQSHAVSVSMYLYLTIVKTCHQHLRLLKQIEIYKAKESY